MSGLSQHRFSALAKIVRYLRSKHQEGDDYPLTLEEILDETNQLHLGNSIKSVSSYICLVMQFFQLSQFNYYSG